MTPLPQNYTDSSVEAICGINTAHHKVLLVEVWSQRRSTQKCESRLRYLSNVVG